MPHAATPAPAKSESGPVARMRDKLVIGTHLFLLLGLAAVHQLIKYRFPAFFDNYPVVLKLFIAFGVVVVCFMVLRLIDVYFIARVRNMVYQYNLRQVSKLVLWLVIAFFVLTIFFQNWYTAVVSFGLISLILGFALQTPITSLIGWVYLLIRQPYRVGDRIQIGDARGDVIDVSYLDSTLWEFGGPYLSTQHPSGRIIKFPNSLVLNETVYNYSWPLFPYIWNEIKVAVAYNSDFEFVSKTMRDVAEEELGPVMLERVRVFRALLEQTPVDELEVREQPSVFFRPVENTWIAAIVRYVVPPREAGRIKNRMIAKMLERLNAEPDRVKFPKDNLR